MELRGGHLTAALLTAEQNSSLRLLLGAVFAGSCVEVGHWHRPDLMAPRPVSPKLQEQRNSSCGPAHPALIMTKGDMKRGTHLPWNQPHHFWRAMGGSRDNARHLTLERQT